MPDKLKVVDASALASLLFGESGAETVADRLEGCSLAAPSLLRYEIGSVCLKKIVRSPRKQGALLKALALMETMEIREVGVPVEEIVPLARRERLTVYDAAYLWLSRELDSELVTLDQKLGRRSVKRRKV
jgi:predicted nucleic acid-binding protein